MPRFKRCSSTAIRSCPTNMTATPPWYPVKCFVDLDCRIHMTDHYIKYLNALRP